MGQNVDVKEINLEFPKSKSQSTMVEGNKLAKPIMDVFLKLKEHKPSVRKDPKATQHYFPKFR